MHVQRAVADYLDAEAARIDVLVELRRRILELLAERRRLATDRTFADSSGGRAWPVVKLKHVVVGFVDTLHATAPGEDDGPGYIVGTSCIKGGSLNLAVARRCSTATLREWTKRAVPRPGDVLLTREAPAGEAALVPAGIRLAPGQRVVLVQTDRRRMLPELVLHSIYSARAGRFFDLLGRETTVAHLNMGDIGELPVVLPPLEVQPAIGGQDRGGARLAGSGQFGDVPPDRPPPRASSGPYHRCGHRPARHPRSRRVKPDERGFEDAITESLGEDGGYRVRKWREAPAGGAGLTGTAE